jgi:DNA-binding NtrC family response regulator
VHVVVALESAPEELEHALALRGHQVTHVRSDAILEGARDALIAADLVFADVEVAEHTGLVAMLHAHAPGIELVLVGPPGAAAHADVIDQLERPFAVDRALAIVDDLADVLDGERLREPIDLVAYESLFAGDSPQIRELLRRVRLLARSDAPVWIFGDDGSGRAIIARAIHDRSARRKHPFLAFNLLAYTDDELARVLFEGPDAAVHRAREGSLFLERIVSAGPALQRALVHYLESRPAESARLLVGVQRDAAAQPVVASDLYYRLKVLEVEIPSLKERARDLEQIVARMLDRLGGEGKRPMITASTLRLLERYSFPGNLLELAHALTHAVVLARDNPIEPQHLPYSIRGAAIEESSVDQGDLEQLDVVAKRFERDYLLRVLRSVGGNRGRAAEILGLSRKGLWGKLKAHGISDDDIDGDAASE